jgi:phosphatidylinositol N-acetylglucosaminyltransferase subunit C
VSPVTVVGWGSLTTVLGWAVWDFWVGKEGDRQRLEGADHDNEFDLEDGSSVGSSGTSSSANGVQKDMEYMSSSSLALGTGSNTPKLNTPNTGANTPKAGTATPLSDVVGHPTGASTFAMPPYGAESSSLSPRMQQRLSTLKSALLIYCAVLGLSPILKSLTKSTSSDSIWAMSAWLMCINVFFFDYGGGVGAK